MLIVTGMSGAGKSTAVQSLEDLGYFCVDNLPPTLIPKFAEICAQSAQTINNIALVVDIRVGEFFSTLSEVLADLKKQGVEFEILFLEASDEVLVRRYKESRRRHPLGNHGEVLYNIREERTRLEDLRGKANKVIDTSNLTNQQLKEEIINSFRRDMDREYLLRITVISFGFKYGIPLDSDLVIDVRFLPNPHYIDDLKVLTGNDARVQNYVMGFEVTQKFMEKFCDLIDFLIPRYVNEGKTTLMIAIGCTGGMHRSVTLANRLGDSLVNKGSRVTVRHRDINRKKW